LLLQLPVPYHNEVALFGLTITTTVFSPTGISPLLFA
jgi:hypothetical protein